MRYVALFLALVLAGLAVPLLFPGAPGDRPEPRDLPWQIEPLADGGSRVFGLALGTPGTSTLADARQRFGGEPQVAILAAPGEPGSLEAYFELVSLGLLSGRMILTLDTTPEMIAAMAGRATRAAPMEGSTRRITLAADDLLAAERLPLRAIAFIPAANLDEATVLQRFGQPAERIRASEHAEHFLYPAKGLDIVLDAKGKELLQYVAPRHFARLREPLRAAR